MGRQYPGWQIRRTRLRSFVRCRVSSWSTTRPPTICKRDGEVSARFKRRPLVRSCLMSWARCQVFMRDRMDCRPIFRLAKVVFLRVILALPTCQRLYGTPTKRGYAPICRPKVIPGSPFMLGSLCFRLVTCSGFLILPSCASHHTPLNMLPMGNISPSRGLSTSSLTFLLNFWKCFSLTFWKFRPSTCLMFILLSQSP